MMRITHQTSEDLNKLSEETGMTKQALMEKAMEYLMRKHFLEKTNQEYLELKKNPQHWQTLKKESEDLDNIFFDATLDEE